MPRSGKGRLLPATERTALAYAAGLLLLVGGLACGESPQAKPAAPESGSHPEASQASGNAQTKPAAPPELRRKIGGHIAYVTGGGTTTPLFVAEPGDGIPGRELGGVAGIVSLPAWSPDGDSIAYLENLGTSSQAVRIASADGGAPRRIAVGHSDPGRTTQVFQLAWAPAGDRIAILRGDPAKVARRTRVELVDEAGRTIDRSVLRSVNVDSRLSWSPNGRRLVYRSVPSQAGASGAGNEPFRPFGALAIASLDGHTKTLALPTKATDPAWSPDGSAIAFASPEGIATVRPSGREFRVLVPGQGQDLMPAWSPDGHWLTYAHQTGDCSKRCRQDLYVVRRRDGKVYSLGHTQEAFENQPAWGQ